MQQSLEVSVPRCEVCQLCACVSSLVVHCSLQAQGLGVQELQCQASGGSADALEASALSLLELNPDFITVGTSYHACSSFCWDGGIRSAQK